MGTSRSISGGRPGCGDREAPGLRRDVGAGLEQHGALHRRAERLLELGRAREQITHPLGLLLQDREREPGDEQQRAQLGGAEPG